MNNLQRLQLETKGIKLEQEELVVYLQENYLEPFDEYYAISPINKRNIYSAALNILESIANDVSRMKTVKIDDTTVSDFSESIQNRIDQLERKIRTLKVEEQSSGTNFFMLFDS
ncbi:hypothetical protein IOC57_06435 [Bacillus sp. SD075]|uniref:hypothetical protein n=1 Tax=Bacillus sp. SD075 TaxID=2781732 RepID=UPI001A9637D3|nr:hypothetical protein [Bacillus sp. SD075]MBO0997389.1 hypothetical protein [Bacillus sp. SD075]